MKGLALGCYALGCLGVAALGGCGGRSSNGAVPTISTPDSSSGHRTFKYTGKERAFTVPSNVTQIRVIALGANGSSQYDDHFGFGARVSAVIPVTGGEQLYIFVGGNGSGGTGGFNGGANGGTDG